MGSYYGQEYNVSPEGLLPRMLDAKYFQISDNLHIFATPNLAKPSLYRKGSICPTTWVNIGPELDVGYRYTDKRFTVTYYRGSLDKIDFHFGSNLSKIVKRQIREYFERIHISNLSQVSYTFDIFVYCESETFEKFMKELSE
ncbi:gp63 [Sphingomonas phage PAU]|uniref:gp63 n=1 Tax=Sphingomonas phage PAU TaxID=1150991 RepID=UPI00025731C9|nr:gp63 [Sphingomonas phage PAU]AFF28061.1 gp63 [Sphingomonas phage PAU]